MYSPEKKRPTPAGSPTRHKNRNSLVNTSMSNMDFGKSMMVSNYSSSSGHRKRKSVGGLPKMMNGLNTETK